jgi:hypothetical protein
MEISWKLLLELLEWCVKYLPHGKNVQLSRPNPDDFKDDIKSINPDDPNFLGIIVYHLNRLLDDGYIILDVHGLYIQGITINGQMKLDELREKYSK